MKPTRRTFLAGISVLAVSSALSACGGDDDSSATDGTSGGSGSEGAGGASGETEAAFPATITHKYGETTVEAAPQRIVCVGLTDQDAVIALGMAPVGVTKWFGQAEGFIFPWAQEAFGDAELPEVLEDTNGIQVEKIAALAPDLIVGQYSGMTEKEYELLSKLAPTVAQSGDYADYGTPWDEAALRIGTAMGQPETMQAIIDDVKAQVAQAAADNPEFEGKTAAVVTPYEGLFVYGPEDPRSRMLVDLGFTFPEVLASDDGEFGTSLSAERTSDLDQVDVAIWLGLDRDTSIKSIFEGTATSQEGRYIDIVEDEADNYYVGHSFVTPLSIPYILERYIPQLVAAVDSDPSTEPPVAEG